jgi:hypothetical protein
MRPGSILGGLGIQCRGVGRVPPRGGSGITPGEGTRPTSEDLGSSTPGEGTRPISDLGIQAGNRAWALLAWGFNPCCE